MKYLGGGEAIAINVICGHYEHSGFTGKAVVVRLDSGYEWVSWEQAQYVPCWNVGGPLFTTEWLETGGTAPAGYNYEPIHDKDLEFSHPKLLQCSDLHALVQWDYQLVNTLGKSFLNGTKGRETHAIHPGGYAVRVLEAFPGMGTYGGRATAWENFEVIFLNPPRLSPVDYLEERVATFMNLKGDTWDYVWDASRYCAQKTRPWRYLCEEIPSYPEWSETIVRIHLRGYPDVFAAFPQTNDRFPHHESCGRCDKHHPLVFLWHDYPLWMHWPCSPDREFVVDRPATPEDVIDAWTHSSVTSGGPFYDWGREIDWKPKPGDKWHFLYGIAPNRDEELRDLVDAWLNPAAISCSEDLTVDYDLGQMMYIIRGSGKGPTQLTPQRVLVNPLIRWEKWEGAKPQAVALSEGRRYSVKVEMGGDDLFLSIPGKFENHLIVELD
ncbi:MAG: hypothetical protein GX977_14570 [Firmicutes bacterium]|nr:hypothetical protein [Bacillota bacterium]